ncbi:uncharacterized protein LOC118646691 [Monomorium pharaonis]|uniref:uncharacterized protein LOC118646691 n=1 Tax=Monomorium pharaonis TaxID=307658 RepID=UPI001747C874|nr:uncharacterized protein LOC118646691 [Monomorium pharaonis]
MEALVKRRGQYKGRVTAFKTYITKITHRFPNATQALDETHRLEIRERLTIIREVYGKYDQVQAEIDELTVDEGDTMQYRETFEEEYFNVVAQAEGLLARGKVTQRSLSAAMNEDRGAGAAQETHTPVTDDINFTHNLPRHANQNIIFKTPGIRLPTIELPKFKGDVEEWLGFRDTFESLIHTNETIDPIQKFHYLKAALEGSAAQIIKSFEFSAANYAIAWETISNRFNNKSLLTYNHIRAIFSISSIKEESAIQLRNVIDTLNKHLRALNVLGQSTEHWDALLIYLLSSKLDSITAREWEKEKADKELPTLEEFKVFLSSRANLLETLDLNKRSMHKSKPSDHIKSKSFLVQRQECAVCTEAHHLSSCPKFLQFTPQRRAEALRTAKLCLNCMKPGHFIKNCKGGTCRKCAGKHNTLLHFEKASESTGKAEAGKAEENNNTSPSLLCSHNRTNDYHVILSTAIVFVEDSQGKKHKARAILDPGSQSSLVTNRLCEELQLDKVKVMVNLEAVNGASCQVQHKCKLNIAACHNKYEFQLSCLVIPEITGNLPNNKVNTQDLQIPSNIKLADPNFHVPARVDILIGADWFWNLLCIGQIKLGKTQLTMQKTRLGWIAAGPMTSSCATSIRCHLSKSMSIEEQVAKFWEIDEYSDQKILSQEEKECELHFSQTTKRNKDGRFIVSIPFKEDPSTLGESYNGALRRLISLENKLQRNPELKEQYTAFLEEYKALHHMTKVDSTSNSSTVYYMPHHSVVKIDSLTTKVRVVFDASATTDNGISLNHIQMIGSTLQDDLFSILVRFRSHAYVVASDIEKMYRQVLIAPEQRSLQRILWRQNPEDPIEVFELNTVTYGTASAPYLATRCIRELAVETEQQWPDIARIIRQDFYVDDLLTGAESIEEARDIVHKISSVLNSAGFKLRKWIANEAAVIEDICTEDQNPNGINFKCGLPTKILGLVWQAHQDMLVYSIEKLLSPKVSKRQILSEITRIFDPLGLLSPCLVLAKILLQKLWMHKLSWDEAIPADLHSTWIAFRNQINDLNQIEIPRHVICRGYTRIELHGFADAAQGAYGACIYIRSMVDQNTKQARLLCSKTRVAPLKQQTIPRLELCAALTLARLTKKVTGSLNILFDKITYWSDSTIVLNWIQTQPSKLQVFVSNRVAEIQELTDIRDWRHVPTEENSADLLSRGVFPNQLWQSRIWWYGPSFLSRSEDEWPVTAQPEVPTMEMRRTVCAVRHIQPDKSFIFEISNNLNKLIRIAAYCRRFIINCKNRGKVESGGLTAIELRNSLHNIAKIAQRESFPTETRILQQGGSITQGKLATLNAFIDKDNLIRVGGRLRNSEFPSDKKHPIVLLADHQFTRLLFRSEHLNLLHAGPQLLLSSIREQFWPIGGRNLARKTVHGCIECFKNNPTHSKLPLGQLPRERVSQSTPFHNTGVDYAGPFIVRDRKGRGCKTSKAFVCLFVCFATKALHLELVSDLTSEAFIAALRRFSARRGKPARIYSDNGTNFVGANRELKELAQLLTDNATSIEKTVNEIGISWHFIPAHSPHFGGIWEAGVKSTKHHLKRVAGNAILTYEELYTLLVQIEAILNSRPLTPMSSDPNDLAPLTPAHFLVGRSLTSPADPTLTDVPESRLSRWQLIQSLQQHFWKRWSKEYISELQQHAIKTKLTDPIVEGAMVLIKDDNLPSLKWRLGRVVTIHPGKDNVARVTTIKTSTGVTRIATAKLCPLPIE